MAFERIRKMITLANGDIYYEFNDEGRTILFLQPANEVKSNLINYGFTGPTLLCFPDKKTDFVGLGRLAEESGLRKVAEENGMGIILVNPLGEDWNEEEAGAYETVCKHLGIAQMNFRDGLAIMKDDSRPDEVSYNILGSCVRMYAYGFGSGADYLAKYYLRKVNGKSLMGDLGMADQTMVCVTLKDLTIMPKPETNDIHVVSIGNSEEQNALLKALCGDVLIRDDLDLHRDFQEYTGQYRRWVGRIMKAYNYETEGIICKPEEVMVPISEDNATFVRGLRFMRTKEHKVGYVTFYDKDLDVVNEKHPLMLVFHGGGDCALATASLAEWPQIGQEEGFITVAVEMHMNVSAKEVGSLIDHLCEEYAIDESRIYATGFSMGGIKSWDLYEQLPQRFAALLPMDAIDTPGNNCFFTKTPDYNQDVLVPLFYVGGIASPLPELPCHNPRGIDRLKYVAQVNQLNTDFQLDFEDKENWADPYVGIKGDRVDILHDEMFPESTYFAHYYDSQDGNCYTCLLAISKHAHEIRPFTNRFAYSFVKKFYRNENGEIQIHKDRRVLIKSKRID
ncbi:MAG: hypothetical protein IJI46_02460 [Erysipelotrichaceae bacterium]|nr:hypothetical protein [Erysipelotrichaceae bacterium]